MKINLTEMMRLKGRLVDINGELDSTLNGINSEFDSIAGNINSSGLHQSILNVQDSIKTLGINFHDNMTSLENFMEEQLTSYSITNEEASNSLKNLVNLVQNVFDENGNILMATASATALSYNIGRKADPNIGDQAAYDSGEKLQNKFAAKIGYSEEKWQIVNETYYFFKEKGLSDEQIAGIIGNMTQESALDLRCPTGQYEGLFQWSKSRKPDDFDLQTQLDHAWREIESDYYDGKVLSKLSETTTIDDATYSFAKWFEGYTGEMNLRRDFAKAVYYHIKNNL